MVSCETSNAALQDAVRRLAAPHRDHGTAAVAGRAMVKTALKTEHLAALGECIQLEFPGWLHPAARRMDGRTDELQQRCATSPRSPCSPPCVARV